MSKIQEALRKIQRPKAILERGVASPPDFWSEESVSSEKLGTLAQELDETGQVLIPIDGGLIHIDSAALRRDGYLAPLDQERFLSDQYRVIKRPVLDNATGRSAHQSEDANLIMVTSALPGDGKTFNCINLALSIALEKDLTVLLVDADVAKPQVSDLFGVADKLGLIDVLNDNADVASVTLRTDVPGLSVLPAGSHDEHATELLASRRMGRLVRELSNFQKDRIVVFDSPPLLITNEAKALSSFVGQIVMVVRAGKTPQQSVIEAVGGLDKDKAINLVLNDSASARFQEHYGEYGYGYGYRSNLESDSQSAVNDSQKKTRDE